MVDLAGGGVMAYSELNEPTHVPTTSLVVTRHWLSQYAEDHRHLPWLEDYLTWLEGKEANREYYAWLEQVAPWWDLETWPEFSRGTWSTRVEKAARLLPGGSTVPERPHGLVTLEGAPDNSAEELSISEYKPREWAPANPSTGDPREDREGG